MKAALTPEKSTRKRAECSTAVQVPPARLANLSQRLEGELKRGADPEHFRQQVDHFFLAVIQCAITSRSSILSAPSLAEKLAKEVLSEAPVTRSGSPSEVAFVLAKRIEHGLNCIYELGIAGQYRRLGAEWLELGYGRIEVHDEREVLSETVSTHAEVQRGFLVDTHVEREHVISKESVTTKITFQEWTHRLERPRLEADLYAVHHPIRIKLMLASLPDWLRQQLTLLVAPEFQAVARAQRDECFSQVVTNQFTRERRERHLNHDRLRTISSTALTVGAGVAVVALGALAVSGLVLAAPLVGVASAVSHIDPGLVFGGTHVLTGWAPDEQ